MSKKYDHHWSKGREKAGDGIETIPRSLVPSTTTRLRGPKIKREAIRARKKADEAIAPFRARNERARARSGCPVPPWEGPDTFPPLAPLLTVYDLDEEI